MDMSTTVNLCPCGKTSRSKGMNLPNGNAILKSWKGHMADKIRYCHRLLPLKLFYVGREPEHKNIKLVPVPQQVKILRLRLLQSRIMVVEFVKSDLFLEELHGVRFLLYDESQDNTSKIETSNAYLLLNGCRYNVASSNYFEVLTKIYKLAAGRTVVSSGVCKIFAFNDSEIAKSGNTECYSHPQRFQL